MYSLINSILVTRTYKKCIFILLNNILNNTLNILKTLVLNIVKIFKK